MFHCQHVLTELNPTTVTLNKVVQNHTPETKESTCVGKRYPYKPELLKLLHQHQWCTK